MDELEKIDLIRQRMDVSYREAKEALDLAGGNVVAALIMLEEETEGSFFGKWKSVLARGAAARIRLKKDDEPLFEVPAGAGVIALAGMLVSGELAVLGAVGTVTALLNRCTLEIVDEGADEQDEEDEQEAPGNKGIEIQIDA
jgi:hypothetical protein